MCSLHVYFLFHLPLLGKILKAGDNLEVFSPTVYSLSRTLQNDLKQTAVVCL